MTTWAGSFESRGAPAAEQGGRRASGLRRGRQGRAYPAPGFVLPTVLLVLILLALLAGSFAFEMHADVASTRAVAYRLQTRLAAEAGIERVSLLLRERRLDVNAWYHNPDELHRAIVWKSGSEPSEFGLPSQVDMEDKPAFRFSIVADEPGDDEFLVRYGITNEAAKLNINVATVDQLRTLLAQVVPPEVSVEELADALIDWRDQDNEPGENGAEFEYYASLEPPYRPKNGPFDTVEELLMVKGFTAQILYGEDYDRNGLLSQNEDDGDETFPIDNSDGELSRGLFPYVTVWSRDFNTANDNKTRVYVMGAGSKLEEQLSEYFTEEEVAFIGFAASEQNENLQTGLVDLLKPFKNGDEEHASPFETEDLHRILDRLTVDPNPEFVGLIDVNTAPAEVLRCVRGMTEPLITEIITRRATLTSEAKATPAWLFIEQLVDDVALSELMFSITTRGQQFTIESLGYADHVGTVTRLQAIIEMRGPVAQIVYYRDLTPLGIGYPIRLEDEVEGGQPSVIAPG
ncbi:MAG: general secretion pathway protein GspK [Phycisphaerales bacterium]|nr:MAG: general secretion pathway protein GspK [Phycisphaerales bacterium]